jgi:hypothetical protein
VQLKLYILGIILLSVCGISFPALGQTCSATISSGTSLMTAVQNVSSGGTVCLNAGSYSFSGTVTKSSMTYVQPAKGVTAAQVTISSANVGQSSNITFTGMTVGDATIGTTEGDPSPFHIHFQSNTFTGPLCIYTSSNMTNADIVVDGNSFAGVGQSCTEGRIGIQGLNTSHSADNGVVISNNMIGPGGAADGIQITGSARGTRILNNEFTGIKQSLCGTIHCDPIQFYGADNTDVEGNYFHGNSTGVMNPDGNGSPTTYRNNVFVTDGEYPDQIVCGGCNGDTIDHNTFANGARIRMGKINTSSFSASETMTNNIISGGFNLTEGQTTGGLGIDYDLIPGGGGGGNGINGSPTYVGGSSPSSYVGYQLASTSLGKKAGSDGKDIGPVFDAQVQVPLPPMNLSATAH